MRWYVFDEWDCFDSFATAAEAAKHAEFLRMSDIEGITIKLMTEGQFNKFCKGE